MTNEERERILAESRAHIEAARKITGAPRIEIETPLAKWKREANEFAAEVERENANRRAIERASRQSMPVTRTAETDQAWNEFVDAKIEAALEDERERNIEIIGEVLAGERKRSAKIVGEAITEFGDKIGVKIKAEIREATADLQQAFDRMREMYTRMHHVAGGEVVDVPRRTN